MSAFRKRQPQDIHAWVRIATIELTPPVKKRFLLEIEEHYSEAIAVHQVGGLSEQDAQKEALAELGDPNEAAKRYRKQHLTIWEADKIKRALKRKDMPQPLWWVVFCFIYFFASMQFKSNHQAFALVLWGTWVLGNIAVSSVGFAIVRRRSKQIWLLFLVRFSSWILMLSSFLFVFGFGFEAAVVCIASIIFLYHDLPLWFKLRHIADVWSEIAFKNE